MRISRRLLQPDERVVLTAAPHPIRLAAPVLRAFVGIVAVIGVGALVTPATGDDPVDLLCAAVALFMLGRLIRRVLSWRRQRVVVTDQRLIQISGGLVRRVGSVRLDQISQVELVQGPLARWMRYGKVEVATGAEVVVLPSLRDAHETWGVLCDLARLEDGVRPLRGRQLAPGLPFDRQDTGPLPRIVV